jgi:peptidoglycan/LPS O-acetylase OafA/YrhL
VNNTHNSNNNLNMIRLLAALQVLFVHSINHLNGVNSWSKLIKIIPGVPVFYFISGFLIFAAYQRHRGNVKNYFWNRFIRIFPALWISIVIGLVLVWATGYFHETKLGVGHFILWLISQATCLQFYNPSFLRKYGTGVFNGALWTISVEIQFYILIPFISMLVNRKKWVFCVVFIGSVIFHLVFVVYCERRGIIEKLIGASFLPWLYMFMSGVFVSQNLDLARRAVSRLNKLGLVIAYLVSTFAIGSFDRNASNAINPVSFILLAIMLFWISETNISIGWWFQDMVRKNDVSYGVYLYHMLVINFVIQMKVFNFWFSATIVLIASVLLAMLSWSIIERKILRYKK